MAFVSGDATSSDYPDWKWLRRSVGALTNGQLFRELPADVRGATAQGLLKIAVGEVRVRDEELPWYVARTQDAALLGLSKRPIHRALPWEDQTRVSVALFSFASGSFKSEPIEPDRTNRARALPFVIDRLHRKHIISRLPDEMRVRVGELLLEYALLDRGVWLGPEYIHMRVAPVRAAIRALRSPEFASTLRGTLGREAKRVITDYERGRLKLDWYR